ncbi:MAG: hypothetical protein Q7T26_02475 [Dehalococcoidia bacterium]|nr:hypothetical protein [Dehalococcoidia bacterium]
MADEQGSALVRLDPATGAVLSTVPLGQNRKPHALTYDGASVWVNFSDGADLVQMNSATGAFRSNRTAQFGSADMLYDGRFLWIASHINRAITRFSPSANIVDATFTGYDRPWSLAFDGAYLWVGDIETGLVTRYRPWETETLVRVDDMTTRGGDPWSLLYTNGDMWATIAKRNVVLKFRTADRAVYGEYPTGGSQPHGIATDGRSVWVANYGDGTVARLSNEGAVQEVIRVGRGPEKVIFDGTYVWVSNSLDGTVTRIRP